MAKRICDNKCINNSDKIILLHSVGMSINMINEKLKGSLDKLNRDILIIDLNNFIKVRDNLNITPECK